MEKIKQLLYVIILGGITFYSCNPREYRIPDGSYVAFSLCEAQRRLNENQLIDSELFNIGGITRLVGMVIDRENNDIILVGKKARFLPKARFDDLIVALRTRLKYNDLPMVSIDPSIRTMQTGKEEVHFGGHIENTFFGQDFLACDILLKKYSLDREKQLNKVKSYKTLVIENELDKLHHQGIETEKIIWINPDSLISYNAKSEKTESNYQSRFWFNYRYPYNVRIRNDVFCIMSLDIIVQNQVKFSDNTTSNIERKEPSLPDSIFTAAFSDSFYPISDLHPCLKRIKLLFDMTAIAEGLKNTKDLPDLTYLLNNYPVALKPTIKEFDMIKECALIQRNDGIISMVTISGGIRPSIDLEWLNAGDVSYLKKFVLDSRPEKSTLFWKLPINKWEMPNSYGIIEKSCESNDHKNIGCSVNISIVGLYDLKTSNSQFKGKRFSLIQPPFIISEPVMTDGVDMKMRIDTTSFFWMDSLLQIRNRILKN